MFLQPRWITFLSFALGAAVVASHASAVPIITQPPVISGLGDDVQVTFVSASAADQSQAFLMGLSNTPLFANNSPSFSPGFTVNLGNRTGPLNLGLTNVTTGTTFSANTRASDGFFHARFTTNLQDLIQTPPAPAVTSVLSSETSQTPLMYVGFEDLLSTQGSDFDYNDLVLAVSNVDPPTDVPEPASIAVFSTVLLGAFASRRRNRSKALASA